MKAKNQKEKIHEPVLVKEVVEAFRLDELAHLKSQSSFIDATVGAGGHAQEFVKRGHYVLGIDADPEMLAFAGKKLNRACPDTFGLHERIPTTFSFHERGYFKLVQGNFIQIDRIAKENNIDNVNGILFDLGTSSLQLKSHARGMSFSDPKAYLDMRLDFDKQGVTAADLLNSLSVKELTRLFSNTLEYRLSRRIARTVVKDRAEEKYSTVGDFVTSIKRLGTTRAYKDKKTHPATLPFLALRIAVNSELENLIESLPKAFALLAVGGRLAVISFHSGEDVLVKKYFRELELKGMVELVTKKPIVPSEKEKKINPSARSAKMRVVEKT